MSQEKLRRVLLEILQRLQCEPSIFVEVEWDILSIQPDLVQLLEENLGYQVVIQAEKKGFTVSR